MAVKASYRALPRPETFLISERTDARADSDPSAEIGNGSFSGLAQKCFQFAEGLFNWIEIGRIFRQIKQPRTRSVDDLLHSDTFVGREVGKLRIPDSTQPKR